jgi:flagellar basal body-associated protein FliL
MKSRSIFVLIVVLVSILAGNAIAQTFRGSIKGTITDTTGAAVPGAQV